MLVVAQARGYGGAYPAAVGAQISGLSLAVVVGLLAAVLSAPGTNLSFLFKHRGAVAAADVDARHLVTSRAA